MTGGQGFSIKRNGQEVATRPVGGGDIADTLALKLLQDYPKKQTCDGVEKSVPPSTTTLVLRGFKDTCIRRELSPETLDTAVRFYIGATLEAGGFLPALQNLLGEEKCYWENHLEQAIKYQARNGRKAGEDSTLEPTKKEEKARASSKVRRMDLGAFLSEPSPQTRWVAEGLIPAEELSILAGPPGVGKSMVVLLAAVNFSLGRPFLGRNSSEGVPRGVCYYTAEDGDREIHRRIADINQTHPVSDEEQGALKERLVILRPNYEEDGSPDLLGMSGDIESEAASIPGGVGLIIIDTLNATAGTADRNDSGKMSAYLRAAVTLQRRLGCGVLILHHTNKSAEAEGSSLARRLHPGSLLGTVAIPGTCRVVLQMASLGAGEAREAGLDPRKGSEGGYVILGCSKSNLSATGSHVLLERDGRFLVPVDGSEGLIERLLHQGAKKLEDRLLMEICQAGGSVSSLDRPAVLEKLWPGQKTARAQLNKAKDELRKKGYLSKDNVITKEGKLRAEGLN